MNDLILEIDSYLWWVVIALAVLAVVLSALKSDVKTVARLAEQDITLPPSREEGRPVGTYKEPMGKPVDTTISKYRSAKLQSCKREIVMLERLSLITDLRRVEPEQTPELITREQPDTMQKRDHGTKKRGFLD